MPLRESSEGLWKRASALGACSALVLYLAEVASDRLSLSQAAFFLLAAAAEARGQPTTRSRIMEAAGDSLSASIRNSYKQLMVPSRVKPGALGWLGYEVNPDDEREKVLRLTDKGKAILVGALMALQPLEVVGHD